ncbi:MAG: hypothetical protein PHV68_08485 [Candidatus Gastranaerophilales bacterium]|nr:hypothetical protein [Candidatus Gastranaerophilales bacterium]
MNEINNTFSNFIRTSSLSTTPVQNAPIEQKGNNPSTATDTVVLLSGGTATGAVAGYVNFKLKASKFKADFAQEVDKHKQALQEAFDNNKMVKMLKEIVKTSPDGIKNTEQNIKELKDYMEESKKNAVNGKVKIEQYDIELEEVLEGASKRIRENEIKKQLLEKNKAEAESKLQNLLNKMVKEPIQDLISQKSLEEKQLMKNKVLKGAGIGLIIGGIIAIINHFNKSKGSK